MKIDGAIHFIRFLVNEDVHLDWSNGWTIVLHVQQYLFASSMIHHERFRHCIHDFASTTLPIHEHCGQGIFWNHLVACGVYVYSIRNQCLASNIVPWSDDAHDCRYPLAYAILATEKKERKTNNTIVLECDFSMNLNSINKNPNWNWTQNNKCTVFNTKS